LLGGGRGDAGQQCLAGDNGTGRIRMNMIFPNGQLTEALKLSVVLPDKLALTVDYRRSFPQMIAAGGYDWISRDLTSKCFPVVTEGVVRFEGKLFHFDRDILTGKALEATRSADAVNPWEPGKIEHLLAFGAQYPEEQRKYPILALASVAQVDGDRYVPCLSRDGGGRRHLSLPWWHSCWNRCCRFLAVRGLSSAALRPSDA
jgi:hypothetical protein